MAIGSSGWELKSNKTKGLNNVVKKKMAVSRRTANILRKVIAYWRVNKHRLDMNDWGVCHLDEQVGNIIGDKGQKVPPCRTTACLAGTVLLVTTEGRKFLKSNGYFDVVATEKKEKQDRRIAISFPHGTESEAAEILQIDSHDGNKLFYTSNWGELGDEYEEAETAKGRFNAAVKRIEQFIATGE